MRRGVPARCRADRSVIARDGRVRGRAPHARAGCHARHATHRHDRLDHAGIAVANARRRLRSPSRETAFGQCADQRADVRRARERMTVEAGHRLNILLTALLSVAALATSWAGYQASLW